MKVGHVLVLKMPEKTFLSSYCFFKVYDPDGDPGFNDYEYEEDEEPKPGEGQKEGDKEKSERGVERERPDKKKETLVDVTPAGSRAGSTKEVPEVEIERVEPSWSREGEDESMNGMGVTRDLIACR